MGCHFKIIESFIYLFLLFSLTTNNATGQELIKKDQLNIVKCSDFEVNGMGDNLCWDKTDWVPLTQRKMSGNQYQTRAKVLYSDSGIYFIFHC